jgi:RimJ/RimL family protein N-acetyltransferase
MMRMTVVLRKAALADAGELYALQIEAFAPLLEKYRDYATNPGAEAIGRTVARLGEPDSFYYFIRLGEINIGAIRLIQTGDLCKLKQIYILPEHQGHGYAQQAIALAEALHADSAHWELDTIKQEAKLCHLYEKLGYRRTGEEKQIKDGMTLVFYRK